MLCIFELLGRQYFPRQRMLMVVKAKKRSAGALSNI